MKNAHLWRALGRNTIISIILFGALLGLLWLAETIFPEVTLLKWFDPAWVVGIPASIIGVSYILTIRDPQNYTGFYAGIVMSILLGVQFMLQRPMPGVDSAFLFFCVFIPFQIKSIITWMRPSGESPETDSPAEPAPFKPEYLSVKAALLSVLILIIITAADYLFATWYYGNTLGDAIESKLLGGLLISSSILANFWLIYRKTDAWFYWVAYSIAGIGLFIIIGNIFSIVLFLFFLVINGMAGLAWIKLSKK